MVHFFANKNAPKTAISDVQFSANNNAHFLLKEESIIE